jgi:hypothetical protein
VTLAPTDRSSAPVAVAVDTWTDATITFKVPNPLPPGTTTPTGGKEWQLMVTRSNGKTTPIGVTLTYEQNGVALGHVHVVAPPPPLAPAGILQPAAPPNTAIQDVIDAAHAGDLVIVPTNDMPWNEYLVMWKPIRLQGAGAGTIINGVPNPENRVPAWHDKIIATLGDDPFIINECPAVQVLGETNSLRSFAPGANPGDTMFFTGFDTTASRIDGFTFKGAIHGGAINAYDKASNLRIGNNKITGNMGDTFNGGISIQDALKVNIIGNTIANNDSPAVALNTFPPDRGVSTSLGAGVVSHPHTLSISPATPAPYNFPFSNPVLKNNIIWHNHAWHFDYSLTGRARRHLRQRPH